MVKDELVLEPEEGIAEGVNGRAAQWRGICDAGGERKVVGAACDGFAAVLPDVLNAQRRESTAVRQAGNVRENEALGDEDCTARLLRYREGALDAAQQLRVHILQLQQRHVEAEDGAEEVRERRGGPRALHRVEALSAISALVDQVIVDSDGVDLAPVEFMIGSGMGEGKQS